MPYLIGLVSKEELARIQKAGYSTWTGKQAVDKAYSLWDSGPYEVIAVWLDGDVEDHLLVEEE